MFHHFHDDEKHPNVQGSISARELEALLKYVNVERILSPNEWLAKLAEKKLSNEDLCLTFDDALLCQVEVALPVLERYKLKAFWFVYSSVFEGGTENLEIYRFFRTKYFNDIDDFYKLFFQKVHDFAMDKNVDEEEEAKNQSLQLKLYPFQSVNDNRFRFFRDTVLGKENYEKIMDAMLKEYELKKTDISKNLWMSDKNLKYLVDNGHAVGLHSYSHPTMLESLSPKEQHIEYQKNYSHIKRVTDKNPCAVSHPCNSYNDDTLKILAELGINCGFRSNMFRRKAKYRLNLGNLEIAREDHANLMRMVNEV